MLLNNAVSAAIGFVPIVGDIALATFKANSRNAAILEEFLRIRGAEFLKAQEETANANASTSATGATQVQKNHGWFSRRTKSKEQVPTTSSRSVPATPVSPERGRFVEDVPSGEMSKKQ